MNTFAQRVHQLEALVIDNQCKDLLYSLFEKSFQLLCPSNIREMKPEINFIIDFLYFRFTIAKDLPLPGQILQNIKFAGHQGKLITNQQKLFYFLTLIFGKYIWKRLNIQINQNDSYSTLAKIQKYLELLYKSCSFVYFCYFLTNKRQYFPHSLILWALQLTQLQIKPGVTRELDFELMNRTIIWDVVAGILKFVLDTGFLTQLNKLLFMTTFLGSIDNSQEQQVGCFICKEEICVMPIKIEPCGHQFCFYCFENNPKNGECPKCKQKIEILS